MPRYGYAFARNDKAVRVYVLLAQVRGVPFLPQGIARLMPLNDIVYGGEPLQASIWGSRVRNVFPSQCVTYEKNDGKRIRRFFVI